MPAIARPPASLSEPISAEEVAGWFVVEARRRGWSPIRQHNQSAGQGGVILPTFAAWKPGEPPLVVWCKADGRSDLSEKQQQWADLLAGSGAEVLVAAPSTIDEVAARLAGGDR